MFYEVRAEFRSISLHRGRHPRSSFEEQRGCDEDGEGVEHGSSRSPGSQSVSNLPRSSHDSRSHLEEYQLRLYIYPLFSLALA